MLVLDETNRQVGSCRITQSVEGLTPLTDFLLSIRGPERKEEMACLIETTPGLLIASLLDAGFPVYPVTPKTVDGRRRAWGAKTDKIDASLLAKHGRAEFADRRRVEPDTAVVQELKALTGDQDSLIQSPTRLVNQLSACLKASYAGALHLFSKRHQRSSLIFLQTSPTPEAALAASTQQITEVLKNARHPQAELVAAKIFQTLHQPHLRADAITTRTKARLMLVLIKQLLPLLEEIAADDEEMERLFLRHEDNEVLSSLARAGKRLAPRLLAEIGADRARYAKTTSLQALAGTSPVPSESGNYSKPHRRSACIKPLRNARHQFAWQSPQSEAWAQDDYRRKRKEGEKSR